MSDFCGFYHASERRCTCPPDSRPKECRGRYALSACCAADLYDRFRSMSKSREGFSAGEVVELIDEIERLREENTGLMLALENNLGRVVYEAPPGMVMVPAPRKRQKEQR